MQKEISRDDVKMVALEDSLHFNDVLNAADIGQSCGLEVRNAFHVSEVKFCIYLWNKVGKPSLCPPTIYDTKPENYFVNMTDMITGLFHSRNLVIKSNAFQQQCTNLHFIILNTNYSKNNNHTHLFV